MSFLSEYPAVFPDGQFNEAVFPNGEIRPHWQAFARAVDKEGEDRLSSYKEQLSRFAEAETPAKSATVKRGLIPFLMSAEDFELISKGLIERAHLLNRVLADIYGEQKLISSGILPPGTVFANPSYFPALKNVKPAGGIFLHRYAAEIERAPDGTFWVVADDTQCPSGDELSVKNRLLLSRVMPEIYAQTAPRRVIDFFDTLRKRLAEAALTKQKDKAPRIVLLSCGQNGSNAAEDEFLARNLGISAVEPVDLSVRKNYVFLKNIDGLKRVDVILRRVNDGLCDPLELTGSSFSGVAGLVNAARNAKVAVINPFGSGTAQIPALNAFIHGIARYFNGKPLSLPSLATWWCGQEKECRFALENMEKLDFVDPNGNHVSPSQREILEHPENFCAQERVNASMMPVLKANKIVPRPVRLRFHLIYDGNGYRVMEGGNAFTKSETGNIAVHDLWIPRNSQEKLKQGVILPAALQPQMKPVRRTFDLTSQTADNMFWLGRNLERSEELARTLRAVFRRFADSPELPELSETATLMSLCALGGHLPFYDFTREEDLPRFLIELKETVTSSSYAYGLHAMFARMKETADALRDRLSADTWEIFTLLPRLLPESQSSDKAVLNRLNSVILHQNALSGLIRENMTREHSWRFMEIGRRLERGMQLIMIMNCIGFCAQNGFNASLDALLEVSDSKMTYRARYMDVPTVPLVFDLLVCDETNPRSLLYQVLKLRQNIAVMKRESEQDGLFAQESEILENMLDLIKGINVMTFAVNAKPETSPLSPEGAQKLAELKEMLTAFSDTLTLSCFVHAAPTRQGPSYNKGKIK